ncbi:MAG: hypothetical protein OES13_09160 [Acidimicrobiia bacterium]|nr:hypothetical protein [Acidimicrobiia bacterium]
MRPVFAATLIVAAAFGILGLQRASRFAPGENATVRALTTEPVRVQLDFTPDAYETTEALVSALQAAATQEPQAEIADELATLARDSGFIENVTSETIERLGTDAAALAFSTTRVDGAGDVVTIIGITIEILPRGRRDGISRAHEDGHAAVNNAIIEECGASVVAFEVGAGKSGNSLVESINDHIAALEWRAHSYYHDEVSEGVFGSHDRAARRAVEALERDDCVA